MDLTVASFDDIAKKKPEKKLTSTKKKTGGRNKQALIADAYEALTIGVKVDGKLTIMAGGAEEFTYELRPAPRNAYARFECGKACAGLRLIASSASAAASA